jgi:hypothetical protein
MRRWSGSALSALFVVALLALASLALPAAALADGSGAASDAGVVLAAEADEEGADLGPDPQPRDAADNPARTQGGYEDQETPFTWGAAWILSFAGLVGVVLLAGLYELLVRRPAQRSST